ncbi:hypothetical protein, partial [Pelagibius marinus]|uniref:hypothetical protein n=1 Tax=Pelagibius marinus TaxID=2762760 RepID=UPI0018729C4C
GAGLLSQITQDFGSSGSFAIGVGEFNSAGSAGGITGNAPDAGDTYTLQVDLTDGNSIAGAFSLDSALADGSATIVAGGDGTFDYYSLDVVAANATIDGVAAVTSGSFETTAGNFDTELFLYDSAGNLVAQDDDGGAGLLSQITQDFGSSGSFAIGVGEFNSAGSPGGITGNAPDAGDTYTLQVDLTDGNSIDGAFSLDSALTDGSATIVAGGDGTFDYYSLDVVAANATIDGVAAVTSGSFETTAGNFDTELFLYDSAGNLVAQDDDGGAGLLSQITQDFGSSGS